MKLFCTLFAAILLLGCKKEPTPAANTTADLKGERAAQLQAIEAQVRAEREAKTAAMEREREERKNNPEAETLRRRILDTNEQIERRVRTISECQVQIARADRLDKTDKTPATPDDLKLRAGVRALMRQYAGEVKDLSSSNLWQSVIFTRRADKEELRDEFPICTAYFSEAYGEWRIQRVSSRDGRDWAKRVSER